MKPALVLTSIAVVALAACNKAPEDTLCSMGPLPGTAGLKENQGGLQVMASAQSHFYVLDAAGSQVGYQRTGQTLGLDPNEYKAKLNSSLHPVSIQSGMLTRCASGTLIAKGATGEHYYVDDDAGTQLAYARLGEGIALFPGRYRVRVNSSRAAIEVKLDSAAEVQTGLAVAQGETDAHFYVLDSTGNQLAYSKLSKPIALLPGTYTIKVNSTTAPINVAANGTSELQTGTVLVQGSPDQHYYVLDSTGTQLAYAKLGQGLSVLPGKYILKLNGSTASIEVQQGSSTGYSAAIVTVNGKGADHYYVLDSNGTQLAYSKLNEPLALTAGSYSVKIGNETKPLTLTAGESKALKW